MSEVITVTSKGQIVIPSKLRKKLGIRKGTRVAIVAEGNCLLLQPITPEYIHSLRGMLPDTTPSALDILFEDHKRDREL
ncbi:MAG TPA: AbrB/MazE/SpoVT family DNA-binding domain-containing protein [Candidatus Acidoferrales bacterium]|jgi:AbrB family looped-hinge helix DNA binding protein